MQPSRDDFVIAIRSAFLKRGTRQKFSLFTLLIISIFLLFNKSIIFLEQLLTSSIFVDLITIETPIFPILKNSRQAKSKY